MNILTLADNKVSKLSNGQLVDTEYLEKELRKTCHYVQYVVIGLKDGRYPFAIIFPNHIMFTKPNYEKIPEEGCFCPRNINEIGRCLSGCINSLNHQLLPEYARINAALIIGAELSVEDGTLTPALQTIPENIITKYKNHISNLFGSKMPVSEETYNMKFPEHML